MTKVLLEKSLDFAVLIVEECNKLKANPALTTQLIKSGTSIGANLREAVYAQSTADFKHKLKISLKECYETEYWLELFLRTNILSNERAEELLKKCRKIRAMLVSSINRTLDE